MDELLSCFDFAGIFLDITHWLCMLYDISPSGHFPAGVRIEFHAIFAVVWYRVGILIIGTRIL